MFFRESATSSQGWRTSIMNGNRAFNGSLQILVGELAFQDASVSWKKIWLNKIFSLYREFPACWVEVPHEELKLNIRLITTCSLSKRG